MERRLFLTGLGAVSVLPWLPSCKPSTPLSLGIHPWIGYEALYLARDFDWLPDEVQLSYGETATDSLQGLASGKLDAACLTLDEMLRVREQGLSLTAITVFDISAGADVVLARPEITKPLDLAGKRIGVENSATGALVLNRMLEAAGLDMSSVTRVTFSSGTQLDLWESSAIDAIVTYEPTASMIRNLGANLLYDSREMPDTILDVLAIRTDLPGGYHHVLKSLVASHFKGLAHINSNRQDATYRIAAHQGISIEEVKKAFSGVLLPSLEANREYLAPPHQRLLKTAANISRLLSQNGFLKKEDSLVDLINPSFLPESI